MASSYYDTASRQQATMYFNCMAGERHVKYLQGAEAEDKIDVIGRLAPTKYTDKNGTAHEGYSILVDDIDITRKSAGTAPASTAGQQRPQAPTGQQQYQSRYQSQQAPAPQQSNRYEQNPFGSQGQSNGFRPATYSY